MAWTRTKTEYAADDVEHLKACINNLIGILAISAIWCGGEPPQILSALLDMVLGMLRVDFVCAGTKNPANGAAIEMIRCAHSEDSVAALEIVRRAPGAFLTDNSCSWPRHIQGTDFSVAFFRMGLKNEMGVLAAGSRRSDFPTQFERLLLNVAANQAGIGLQQAQRLEEQTRLTKELDRKVAQRTDELLAVETELHKEIAHRRDVEEALRQAQVRVSGATAVSESDMADLRKRYALLTPREREVLPFVVAGQLSKQTAAQFGISEITIRVHRGQIMRKMQAHSLAALVRMADKLGIH